MKSIALSTAHFALAAILLAAGGHEAAAQSAPLIVIAVDYDIVPGKVDDYLAAAKINAAESVKEPGCQELAISVSEKDPNHVFLIEIYDNDAAIEAHRATDHFKAYSAKIKDLVAKREARRFSSVAINLKAR